MEMKRVTLWSSSFDDWEIEFIVKALIFYSLNAPEQEKKNACRDLMLNTKFDKTEGKSFQLASNQLLKDMSVIMKETFLG